MKTILESENMEGKISLIPLHFQFSEMTLLKDEFETDFERLRNEQKQVREMLAERRAMMEDGHLEAQQICKPINFFPLPVLFPFHQN